MGYLFLSWTEKALILKEVWRPTYISFPSIIIAKLWGPPFWARTKMPQDTYQFKTLLFIAYMSWLDLIWRGSRETLYIFVFHFPASCYDTLRFIITWPEDPTAMRSRIRRHLHFPFKVFFFCSFLTLVPLTKGNSIMKGVVKRKIWSWKDESKQILCVVTV